MRAFFEVQALVNWSHILLEVQHLDLVLLKIQATVHCFSSKHAPFPNIC